MKAAEVAAFGAIASNDRAGQREAIDWIEKSVDRGEAECVGRGCYRPR